VYNTLDLFSDCNVIKASLPTQSIFMVIRGLFNLISIFGIYPSWIFSTEIISPLEITKYDQERESTIVNRLTQSLAGKFDDTCTG
jgi:hypothetical protein